MRSCNFKIKTLFLISFLTTLNLKSQTIPAQRTCGTAILPQQYETWVQSLSSQNSIKGQGQNSIQSIFYIPVIVHVIHNAENVNSVNAGSGNNLNAAQIQDQINILNKDFNGTNADTNLIPAVFKPFLGKFQMYFCLAVVNPTGGVIAEPGIDRINRVTKGWTASPYSINYIDGTIKPNSIWNPNLYMNIWVCGISGGILGYATLPVPGTSGLAGLTGSFGSASTDGVVILNTAFGSIGTAASNAPYNKGRTATHEVGHWIGLRHIWGDGNCATDYCNDTPIAQTSNFNCPTFPYHVGTCSGNTTGEMTMNYMDYTNDACMYMFSKDQKNRAQLIMTNSPMRASLITSTVCNLPSIGNDVGITFVSSPTYSQTLNCIFNINPIINITNFGSTTLNSALFTFNVNGVNTQTLNWIGNLLPNNSTTVALSQISGLMMGLNNFSVNVSLPNGSNDNNLTNNNNSQQFYVTGGTFTLSPSSPTICSGYSVNINASGTLVNFTWSNGATGANVNLSPSVTTIYSVSAGTSSCLTVKTITVVVKPSPSSAVSTTLASCPNACNGIVKCLVSSGTAPFSYSISSYGLSPSINAALCIGSYSMVVTDANGCNSNSTFTIGAGNTGLSLVTNSTFLSCAMCNDGSVYANATSGTGPYTYTWMPGNANTSSVTGLSAGCYTVTIEDAEACSSSTEVCVSFDVGIRSQKTSTELIRFYPNPTNGIFNLQFINADFRKVIIVNVLGQIISSQEVMLNSSIIDIRQFADGIYYLKVVSDTQETVVKIIKQQ